MPARPFDHPDAEAAVALANAIAAADRSGQNVTMDVSPYSSRRLR